MPEKAPGVMPAENPMALSQVTKEAESIAARKRGRGRPPKGAKAMTDVERQRACRMRKKHVTHAKIT
jgi:hypothetical protein